MSHYITTKALRTLILDTIRTVSTFAISNQDEFMEKVRAASQIRQVESAKDAKRKLNKDRKRINELDTIIKKLYESFAVGRITEERFDSLLAEYETEQKTLRTSVTEAEARLSSFEEDTARVEQFLALAKKYTDFSELTTPELTAEEAKRQEQLRRHRIKSRERYQKIKAGEHAVGKSFALTCKCCGKTFESKWSNTLFCSPNCRAKFYRQKAAENRSRECVCENCGVTFTTTRTDVKYCCDDCRAEANRKMRMERYVAKKAAKAEPVLQEIPSTGETEQKQKTA